MKRKVNVKAPIDARTLDEICDLPRDNVSSGDYWFLTDGCEITLAWQKSGEAAKGIVSVPKPIFDKFVRWYETGSMVKRSKP